MLDKLICFLLNLFLAFHIDFYPILHLLFGNLSIMISIGNQDLFFNFIFSDLFDFPIAGIGSHIFIHLEYNAHKVMGLGAIKEATLIIIVLIPNLVNDMLNDFFLVPCILWPLVLFKKFGSINSDFIFLAHEDGKQYLWDVISLAICDLFLWSICSFSHHFCSSVLLELFKGCSVLIVRGLFVK